jgi:molybdopterin molybdotransferase
MAELDVSDLMTVEQALAAIDGAAVAPRVLHVPLELCCGRRLAEDLRSDRDSPPFDKSLMDGYAVKSSDLAGAGCELQLLGRVAAGESSSLPLNTGQTLAIMTGAPLPAGADAVVPVEQTEKARDGNHIRFMQPARAGQYISMRGSEMRAQSIVLPSGTRLNPAQIAVAASIGAASASVFAVPTIAVLGTGDELVDVDQTPVGPQIRGCNNPMLTALLTQWGYTPVDLGISRDDPSEIHHKIQAGLQQDVLLVVGGMSMGERDFVPGILRQLGARFRITKLRIKPGKPFIFAEMPGGKFVFGLPGNPVSAFVCTVRFVTRLLDRISGGKGETGFISAALESPLPGNGPREFYQPAVYDGRTVKPLPWIGSADIFTLSRANALIVRPENQSALAAGATVDVLLI